MSDYAEQLLNDVRTVMVLTDSIPISIAKYLINTAHDEGVKEGMHVLFGATEENAVESMQSHCSNHKQA